MKKYLLLIPALFLAFATFAQEAVSSTDPAVTVVVEKMTAKYQLNEEQQVKMVKIQQRRLRNLSEIASLEQQDPVKFLQKRKAVNMGTDVSLKMLLNKEQRAIFDKDKMFLREKRGAKIAELKAQGMTMEQMEPHLLALEDEQF